MAGDALILMEATAAHQGDLVYICVGSSIRLTLIWHVVLALVIDMVHGCPWLFQTSEGS